MASPVPAVVRLPLDFDPEPLAEDLERVGAEDWTRHRFRTNYEGVWDILPLRAAAGESHPLRQAMSTPGQRISPTPPGSIGCPPSGRRWPASNARFAPSG